MSVSITLKSKTPQYADQTLYISDSSDSSNYDVLAKQVGIDESVKVVPLNADGAAIQLVPSCVKSGESYFYEVIPKTDPETEGTSSKWEQSQLDENAQALKAKYGEMGSKVCNAALNGYQGETHNAIDTILFPDYNAPLRINFTSGIHCQIPKEFTVRSTKTGNAGDVSYEPSNADLENWRIDLLRWAYVCGLENDDKRPKEHMPTATALREAYKQGKEAVCISIAEANWGRVNKDTFKLCSVPVAYAPYEGGKDKHLHDLADNREALRKVFLIGVDDAWTARENGGVTVVTSSDRVPDHPDLQSAFASGAHTAKGVSQAAPGCKPSLQDNCEIVVVGETEETHRSTRIAFEQGLKDAWNGYSGDKTHKPDEMFFDTGAAQRDAFKAGVALRHAEEKRKEDEAKAAELEAQEQVEKPGAVGKCKSFFVESCMDIKSVCWPIFTKDADDRTLCCGTSLGDWTIILLIFLFYYLYLAMWFWAFLEILMVVAEPNRPW